MKLSEKYEENFLQISLKIQILSEGFGNVWRPIGVFPKHGRKGLKYSLTVLLRSKKQNQCKFSE